MRKRGWGVESGNGGGREETEKLQREEREEEWEQGGARARRGGRREAYGKNNRKERRESKKIRLAEKRPKEGRRGEEVEESLGFESGIPYGAGHLEDATPKGAEKSAKLQAPQRKGAEAVRAEEIRHVWGAAPPFLHHICI